MRTDQLLLPTCFDYEYPRLAASQHLFEAFASPLDRGLAAQTHETGGPSVSRRSIRFGGPPGLMRGVFLPRTPEPAEPLTPLSPPHSPSLRFRTSGAFWGRLDSAANPSVKIEVRPAIRGVFHRQETPARLREPSPISMCGHVMGFRFDPALDALSSTVAALRFWRSLAGCGLDSRPRALLPIG